jgi:hypothetical protein
MRSSPYADSARGSVPGGTRRGTLDETASMLRGQRDRLGPDTAARRFHDRLISLVALELAAYRG